MCNDQPEMLKIGIGKSRSCDVIVNLNIVPKPFSGRRFESNEWLFYVLWVNLSRLVRELCISIPMMSLICGWDLYSLAAAVSVFQRNADRSLARIPKNHHHSQSQVWARVPIWTFLYQVALNFRGGKPQSSSGIFHPPTHISLICIYSNLVIMVSLIEKTSSEAWFTQLYHTPFHSRRFVEALLL